jgi:hypothetical protein
MSRAHNLVVCPPIPVSAFPTPVFVGGYAVIAGKRLFLLRKKHQSVEKVTHGRFLERKYSPQRKSGAETIQCGLIRSLVWTVPLVFFLTLLPFFIFDFLSVV